MERSSLITVEIIEIEPVTVYKDVVYDQTVTVRFQDGTEVKLFDPTPKSIENDEVDDVLCVNISVLPKNGVKKAANRTIGVYSPADPSSEWSYDFIGDITDVDLNARSMRLNIGCGIISCGVTEEMRTLVVSGNVSPNDRLYVPASRTDLKEIAR